MKRYIIRFDKDGNPFKSDTDKIPCGIPDWVAGIMVICGVVFGVFIIIGMLIQK
jgi:hypothetical protein